MKGLIYQISALTLYALSAASCVCGCLYGLGEARYINNKCAQIRQEFSEIKKITAQSKDINNQIDMRLSDMETAKDILRSDLETVIQEKIKLSKQVKEDMADINRRLAQISKKFE